MNEPDNAENATPTFTLTPPVGERALDRALQAWDIIRKDVFTYMQNSQLKTLLTISKDTFPCVVRVLHAYRDARDYNRLHDAFPPIGRLSAYINAVRMFDTGYDFEDGLDYDVEIWNDTRRLFESAYKILEHFPRLTRIQQGRTVWRISSNDRREFSSCVACERFGFPDFQSTKPLFENHSDLNLPSDWKATKYRISVYWNVHIRRDYPQLPLLSEYGNVVVPPVLKNPIESLDIMGPVSIPLFAEMLRLRRKAGFKDIIDFRLDCLEYNAKVIKDFIAECSRSLFVLGLTTHSNSDQVFTLDEMWKEIPWDDLRRLKKLEILVCLTVQNQDAMETEDTIQIPICAKPLHLNTFTLNFHLPPKDQRPGDASLSQFLPSIPLLAKRMMRVGGPLCVYKVDLEYRSKHDRSMKDHYFPQEGTRGDAGPSELEPHQEEFAEGFRKEINRLLAIPHDPVGWRKLDHLM